VAKSPTPKKTGASSSRDAARPSSTRTAGRPAGLFTWIALAVVVVVVVVLVVIKVSSGSSSSGSDVFQPTDATTMAQLTRVPASVFNTVGVTSSVAPAAAPIALKGQPALTATTSTGARVPEVFYLGAEYCPYCAAERWPTIVALSRFGTWHDLGDTTSGSKDIYPGTPTFTFLKAHYTSPYLAFRSVEAYTNVYSPALNFYTPLQKPTAAESALFKKYDTSTYIPNMPASADGSIPFISLGNRYLVSGASYSPAVLTGLTRSQIASGLSNAQSPVTAAIVATANYLSAAICQLTKDHPGTVCQSPGVRAAKKAMGIK
jgi:hypothetical protein